MKLSRDRLLTLADETGFQPASLEKTLRLLDLLKEIQEHRDLEDKLALKGGTAINLFYFDAPRLSVDIDLNYVGAQDKETMEEERPTIEDAMEAIFDRAGMTVVTYKDKYASTKWELTYKSPEMGRDTIKVDLGFLMRVPLFPLQKRSPTQLGDFSFP